MNDILREIETEASSPTCVSYEYDPTPTAKERLNNILKLIEKYKTNEDVEINSTQIEFNCPPLCNKCHRCHHIGQPCKKIELTEVQKNLIDGLRLHCKIDEPYNINILNKTRCYLIGQMQYCDGSSWRKVVEAELKKLGVVVFNPYVHPFINSEPEDNNATEKLKKMVSEGKYEAVKTIVSKIRSEDLRMVDICDFIFCYINPKFHVCGTYEEFFRANYINKPIFLVIEGGIQQMPLWLHGVISSSDVYSTIEDAVSQIIKIDNGQIDITNSKWHILKQ